MIPRKVGSWVSRKITDKVSVIEFKSARAAKEGEVPTGRRDHHPPSESRADNPVTPCCVIRDGDTYALGIDGRFHQPFCMSAFDEKAEIKSSGSRDKPNVGPASASNTRADNPPAPPKCSCGDPSCPGPCEHGGCVCEGPHDPNHQGYRQPDSAPPPCDCAGCVWFARARAALALMDEADWHVEAPKGKA